MNRLLFIFLITTLLSCVTPKPDPVKKSHPSHKYNYAMVNKLVLKYRETDYVPVYSDIYNQDGTRKFQLTSTVSIRNTSLQDTAFVLESKYYDSYGLIIKDYLPDSAIVLSPLESIEFVVEQEEAMGGAGANFLIVWGAHRYADQILIQSVMVGTYLHQGISFISAAKKIDSSMD